MAIASSALNSTQYVYALDGGSAAGMLLGPFAPTVYSVALMEVVGNICVVLSINTLIVDDVQPFITVLDV